MESSSPTNLLSSLEDVGVDVPPEEASIGASPTEQFYVAHNRSVLALAVLCLGLCDNYVIVYYMAGTGGESGRHCQNNINFILYIYYGG